LSAWRGGDPDMGRLKKKSDEGGEEKVTMNLNVETVYVDGGANTIAKFT